MVFIKMIASQARKADAQIGGYLIYTKAEHLELNPPKLMSTDEIKRVIITMKLSLRSECQVRVTSFHNLPITDS
jgi:hypothetical protein